MKLREDEMGESGDKGERAGLRTEPWSKQAKQAMKGTETIQEGQRYAGHQRSREEGVFNRDPHRRDTKEERPWGLLRELFWWREYEPIAPPWGHLDTSLCLCLQRFPKGYFPRSRASQGISSGFCGNCFSVQVHSLPRPISSLSYRCVLKQLPIDLLHADLHLHFHAESVFQKSNLRYMVTEKGGVKERKGGMVTRLTVVIAL